MSWPGQDALGILSAPSALQVFTHRPLSSSFLGLPYRLLNINHKKEILRGLWAECTTNSRVLGFGGDRYPPNHRLRGVSVLVDAQRAQDDP